MTQTSRLVLEVDSRSAEQRVNETRQALERLEAEGLATPRAMKAAGDSIAAAGNNAKATTPQLGVVERQFKSLASAAAGLAGPIAAAFSVAKIAAAAQQYTDLTNRLRLVTESTAQLARAQDDVFKVAQASRQSLETTASVYQRIAQNGKQLGLSFSEVASITETVSKSVALSGASAASADAALVQFGQALASGALRGDELNSILEQTPALAQTIARGLGVTIGQLRAMGAEGQLTSEKIITAIASQKDAVDKLAATMQVTAGQAMTAFANSLTTTIGKLDQATGASNTFANSVLSISRALDGFNSGEFLDFFRGDKQSIAGFNDDIGVTIAKIRDLTAARAKLSPSDSSDTVLFNFKFYNQADIDKEIAGLNKHIADTRKTITDIQKSNSDLGAELPKGDAIVGGLSATAKAYVDTQQKALAKLQDNNDAVKEANRYISEHKELTDADKAAILSNAYATNAQTQANKDSAKAVRDSNKAYQEDAGQKMLDDARQRYAVLIQQKTAIDMQGEGSRALGTEAKKLIELETEIANLKEKRTLTASQKQVLAMADLNVAQQKQNAAVEKENELTKVRLDNAAKLLSFQDQLNDSLQLSQNGLDAQVAGLGMGQKERDRIQEDLRIRQDYQKQLAKLQRDYQNIVNPTSEQTDLYDKETAAVKSALGQRLSAQQNYYREVDAAQSNWVNGANAALQDYIDETQNIAGQTYTLFSDSLHGVEDAFVDAATTGKLSFKDLADSIIADLARIVAKAYVVTPILAALGIGGSSADGAGSAGGLGSIFGGGSGGGLMGSLSNISSVVSAAGSKLGQSIIQGFNGGDGLLGGLQGAFSNGADYIGSVITSAFSTGSASAAGAAASLASSTSAATVDLINNTVSIGGKTIGTASGMTAGAGASGLASLSSVLSYIGAAYSVISSFQDYGVKGGATTAGFAAGGAYVGSLVGPIGTAAGAAIGSVLGSFVSSKLFGSGEKYPDLSTSATGRYINGQYTDTGIATGWQTNAPKYGSAADAQMSSVINKFSSTLGNLYEVLGNGADVVAYNTLQQRKTSGKYSTTFGAQLDDGSVITSKQQFKADDIAAALTADYDDIMGTFLAKAIVSSKSLPDYFKAQFTEFANDWDTTADEVIKAIEGVFTRFNGVNDALSLINVQNLKLDNTGLAASDSILNMIGAMSDLDTTTATAKEKVDALNTAVGTYYQAFFSADEQFADLTDSLKGAFAGFGLDLPDTRSAYRDMVEDIDVTTAAGQAMFATLVGLAQNADSYYSTLDQKAQQAQQAASDAAQKIIDGLMGSVTSAESALERAINAQKTSVNDMLTTANQSVSDLTSVASSLDGALKSLRGTSADAVSMLRAQAVATLNSALATAKAGKSLAGFDGLTDALDVVSNNSTDLYSSLEDFNRDQGQAAALIDELNKLNGKQLTSAEKTVQALQDQLDRLDDQLAFAQAQLDALNGVDNSIMGVTAAVNAMNAAVVAALSSLPDSGAGSAMSNTAQANGTIIDSVYEKLLGRDADAAGKQYWQGQLASGAITYDQLAQAIANAAKENNQTIKVPGYATGGNFGGGIRLVGEKGPEIELTGPSKILNASRTAKALGSANSSSGSSDLAERQAWTNKLLNQVLNAINRQTTQGVPALPVT